MYTHNFHVFQFNFAQIDNNIGQNLKRMNLRALCFRSISNLKHIQFENF